MARLKSVFFVSLVLVLICPLSAAGEESFLVLGEFSVPSMDRGVYEITDGIGRILTLVPRGQEPPPGLAPDEMVRIPVKRVVVVTGRDASFLDALGVVETIVGVTDMRDYWNLPHITEGLASGKVANLGLRSSMDLEKLIKLKPELIMTHDESLIPKMTELGIPIVITYGEAAADLETYVNLTRFLAPFFGKQAEALEFVKRFLKTLEEVTAVTKRAGRQPKTIWGDIYEKRVLVEHGHSWAAQLIKAVGGDYLFNPLGLILRRLLRLFV